MKKITRNTGFLIAALCVSGMAQAQAPAPAAATPVEATAEQPPSDAQLNSAAAPAVPPATAPAAAPATTASVPAPATATPAASNDTPVQQVTEKSPPESELKKMSPAEEAIVQNAGMLDTMAPPTNNGTVVKGEGMKVTDILSQPADIRPLPQEYLIVKKNKNADTTDARLTAARLSLARGNNGAAYDLFDELYRKNPSDMRYALGRAVALQRLGQSDEAIAAYEEALGHNPNNVEAMTNMLGMLKGDPDLAIMKLRALREVYPAQPDIAAQLGMVYGSVGDYDNAIKYLDMAEALDPGNMNVMFNKAVAYDRMGKTVQAADLYQRLLQRASQGDVDDSFPLESIRSRLAVIR